MVLISSLYFLLSSRYLISKDKFHEYLDDERNKDLKLAGNLDASEDTLKHESKKVKIGEDDHDANESEKSSTELRQSKDNCKESNKKARGQNKNRPHMKPNQYEHDRKLCTSVVRVCYIYLEDQLYSSNSCAMLMSFPVFAFICRLSCLFGCEDTFGHCILL